jgi:DNA-binding response OmpR family regulator
MPKKILVVDDNRDIRTSVSQILMVRGYEVIEAESGMDCLKQLEAMLPDLVILDIMMPEMNGWDVAARIKQHEKWNIVPIVFLTAKGDDMSMGLGGLASEDYIVKPFDVTDLIACVDRILQHP